MTKWHTVQEQLPEEMEPGAPLSKTYLLWVEDGVDFDREIGKGFYALGNYSYERAEWLGEDGPIQGWYTVKGYAELPKPPEGE